MKKFILLFSLLTSICCAQPIEFVVSASPGGPNDTVTRKIVERLEKQTNLNFVVVNKPGAAHVIGYNYVSNTNKPTLIMSTSEIENNEVHSQLEEIYNTGYFTNYLFVSKKSGIKNLNDLIDLSKQREINFGHGGIGTYSHSAMETICKKTIRCLSVPFKSGAEGMISLLNGTIDAYALVSYGSKQFSENENYTVIHNIRLSKEKSWFKVFGKNLHEKDKQIISSVLKSTESKFFTDIGFER